MAKAGLTEKDPYKVSNFVDTADLNCYEFYMANTSRYGEYDAFQVMGADYKRSRMVNDIEALAVYLKNDLGLKAGDVFSIFMPTNIESLILFYSLNKIGVIVNFIHPLLPPEVVKQSVLFSQSKGIAVVDATVRPYVEMINGLDIPVIQCSVFTYAPMQVIQAALAKMGDVPPIGLNKAVTYGELLKKYSGHTVEGEHHNGYETAVYLNGGGTTGKSKTIKHSSKSLNEILYKQTYISQVGDYGKNSEIIVLPFFHAYGLCSAAIMAPCKGMKVIPLMKADPEAIIDIMKKDHVIGISGTPSMFKKLYASENFDGEHLKAIRYMFVGGDDVAKAFLDDFNAVLEKNGSEAKLCLGYGLTEACAICTLNRNWDYKPGSIGKPLYDMEVEFWDEDHKSVPDGEIGEIAIAGSSLMQGYLTEDREENAGIYFDENGKPWILSGDLGYRDEDGFCFFTGRKKRVIIISGYNVYPGDVDNLVYTLPFIKESCAVQGWKDGKSIVRLYASLTQPGDEDAYKAQIKKLCEDNLSKYAVPTEIEFIEALPRTPLDKINFMKLTEQKPQ